MLNSNYIKQACYNISICMQWIVAWKLHKLKFNIHVIYNYVVIYVGISAEIPILGIPDEIPIYRNFMKWLFIWNWISKIGSLILNNDVHWVLISRNCRYTLFSFSQLSLCSPFLDCSTLALRLLDTHILTPWHALTEFSILTPFLLHKIHHTYTDTRKRIHTLSLRR